VESRLRHHRGRALIAALLVLAATVAFLEVWQATRGGDGVSRDSVDYLAAAQSIVRGDGVTLPYPSYNEPPPVDFTGGQAEALTTFPPLFPSMIALGSMVSGRGGLDVARLLNALAFSLIVALTGLLVWRMSRSWLWSAAASAATLFSPNLILVSSMVWSDAWGTLLVLGCVLLLTDYLRAPRLLLLLAAALVASAAIMDRYEAIALIPVGLAAVLMSRSRPGRALHGAVWTAVALLPVAAWSTRDLLQSGGLSGGALRWHPPPVTMLPSAIDTLVGYLSPVPWLNVSVVVALVVLAAVWLAPRGRRAWRGFHRGTLLIGIGIAALVAVLVATTFLVDASLTVDYRILALVYVLCVAAFASHLGRWSAGWRRSFRFAAWAPLLTLTGISTLACLQSIPTLSASFGYTSSSWGQSPLLTSVNRLPVGAFVVTNAPDFVWLRDGRKTVAEPRLVIAISGQPNPDYAADMAQVQAAVALQGRGWLVLWNGDARWYLPSTGQLQAALHLVPYQTTSDGQIFEILPASPSSG
jgi:hypothetical protein